MKNILIAFAMLACHAAGAQQYVAKTGKAHFFSAATVENIEATSATAVCAINIANKKVVVKIRNSSFKFKDGLMQEHFNENYMESDKYEFSTFDGVITDNTDLTKDGVYDVTMKGTLEIHGTKVDKEIKGKLTVANGGPANGKAKFDVRLADHKIKIPSLLGSNIAETIAVDVDFNYEKYEKK